MKRYLLYIFFFLLANTLFAQKDFRFRNFGISDGLSQSSVTAIVQDEQNGLWIGTQDGLNRFDGKRFEVYTPDETDGLESAYIKCAITDDRGNIWFGTNNGLTKYDSNKETFTTYFINKGEVLQIESISMGEGSDLWVATSENGLYHFNTQKESFEHIGSAIPSKKTTQVKVVDGKTVIVATADQGLYIYQISKDVSRRIMKHDGEALPVINKVVQEKDGQVLLMTSQGVYNLDVKSGELMPKFDEWRKKYGVISVSDIHYFNKIGWLIATSNQGLFVLNDNGEIHQNSEDIFQKTALVNNAINLLFRDNSGTIWIGSRRGISNIDPAHQGILGIGASANATMGITSPSVWSFAEDANYLYVGTDTGLSRYNYTTGKFRQFPRTQQDIASTRTETSHLGLEVISNSLLLVASADGLFELHISESGHEFISVNFPSEGKERNHDRVYAIEHWKGNSYFIASKGGALLYDVITKKIEFFEHNPLDPKNTITKGICRLVYKDKKGKVWFTTSTGGLNVAIEEKGELTIRPYKHNAQIKSVCKGYITSIYQAGDGVYWYGSLGSGLVKWNERSKETQVYNRSNGLPNDVIYGVLRDSKGKLWLTTNKGLCQFDPRTKAVKNYTEVHGLMSNEFNIGAYMTSKSGVMYFGGIYGYNYFNPSELSDTKSEISVVFTKFKLDNKWMKPGVEGSILKAPISKTREINLSFDKRSFTIQFQSSHLSNPELVNYKYELVGSGKGPVLIGTDNEISFNALESGDYELKVYARLADGSWSSYPASIKINIASPFWQTWWFWACLVILLAIATRWFILRRIDASRREQVRLEIKIRERTKEIQAQNEKIELQRAKIEEERNKVVEQQKLLQIEKDKTDKLLRNIIPESTAEELKKRGKARARAYSKVSVLFTDFVGFTKIAEHMNPTELVKKLDVYFTKFDEIIVKNNLEKIKTIGDAYMCAGGVPVRNNTNPMDTVLAALQIQAYMEKRKNDAIANSREYWDLRLGINTGEVTAGVIGSERLAYDIWGATVNQAQRMEMMAEPGNVTVTGATFLHIEPYFECTYRGQVESKSQGMIDMYVVERIKPELSVNGEGIFSNKRFNQIINLHLYSSINYYKAERHIMRVLSEQLSESLYYHSISHTKDVVTAVERIALLENVTDEGLFLLKSAATYHDAGFIEQYDKNEPIGARLAEEILPKYGYSDKHIATIKDLIYVTEIPHAPTTHLQEIMCDADLDYLGRDDFHEIATRLRDELKEHGKIETNKQWDEIQVKFLNMHKYFTETAIKTRKKKKQQNLEEVIARLERDEYSDE
ncbi:MAG: ligand-binding sensor domain-containing protein/class 3 adenylate cyclase [Flavobacteriaceae bacterium]|jgi:ligand-binding sensor domain-containing protein/class 3 adenylate cyclase